jgi:serine/threonine protein kinase
VTKDDIKQEAKAISALCAIGGHCNIIEILNHGWLRGEFHTYYIDMEVASLTLAEYLYGCERTAISIQTDFPAYLSPEIASTFEERMLNMFEVGQQIARGLQFLHSNQQVHRDMKPSNGNEPILIVAVRDAI